MTDEKKKKKIVYKELIFLSLYFYIFCASMDGPRKRPRTPEAQSPSFSPSRALGKTFCTPHGLSIGSTALYNSYEALRNFGEGRYRPLVHTNGTEWWICHKNLKGSEGWVFTDAPPRPWKYSNTLRPFTEPEILPLLHRRGFVSSLVPLFQAFCTDAPLEEVRKTTVEAAEGLFYLKTLKPTWKEPFGNKPTAVLQKSITMCHTQNRVEACTGCRRNHLIVAETDSAQLCNMCCKRYHALIKLFEVIPENCEIRTLSFAKAALVDRCLTIEENMRILPTTVLDYSTE
jgi:hypothetical protein